MALRNCKNGLARAKKVYSPGPVRVSIVPSSKLHRWFAPCAIESNISLTAHVRRESIYI